MYNIERITKDSLKDLLPLYRLSFHKRYHIEYIQQKFDTLPFGAEYMGYIAYYNKIAVACYAVFPCRMAYMGKTILAAQSGDTMTHPDHRKKGLFIQLALKTFELSKENGIKLIFGFPNDNSYNGFIEKLSWKHTESMNLYKIKINTLPIAKVCQKSRLLAIIYKVYIKIILTLHKTSTSFESSVNRKESIVLEANTDYYNYKTYGESFVLNIWKVKVWSKINGALLVGDIEQTSRKNTKSLLKNLKTLAFIIGCRHIIFSFSKGEYWDIELAKYLKPVNGFPIAYFDLGSELPLQKLAFSLSALDTF